MVKEHGFGSLANSDLTPGFSIDSSMTLGKLLIICKSVSPICTEVGIIKDLVERLNRVYSKYAVVISCVI